MQKNWYVVYTKPRFEKKVTSLLTKRKIENFCAYNRRQVRHLGKNKLVLEPLFDSYVFVRIQEDEMTLLKQIEGIVSFVYWKGEPALIKDEEIEIIKEFSISHECIRLEKSKININGSAKSTDDFSNYTMNGKIIRILNKSFRVNLPSLGLTMIAEAEIESVNGRKISFINQGITMES